MSEAFNKWWDRDDLTTDNLYAKDTPAYWAWEGWQAAVKASKQPKQEPMAWLYSDAKGRPVLIKSNVAPYKDGTPLYSKPTKPEWVSLTDEEVRAAYCAISNKEWAIGGMENATKFTQAIEAKLKEKNT
jgi:hypothetical protein